MSRRNGGLSYAQLGRTLLTVALTVGAACATGGVDVRATRPSVFGNGSQTASYVASIKDKFSPDTAYYWNYGGASLEFQPLDTTQRINWNSLLNPSGRGAVVARVRNTSNATFTDGTFTLEPYNVAHQDAYVWVGVAKLSNGTSTHMGFGVYTLSTTGDVTGEWSLVAPAKIQTCPNAKPRTKPAIHAQHPASDGPCHDIGQTNPSMITRLASLAIPEAHAATTHTASAALAGLGGLWISCSGGCCQVSTM